MQYPLLDAFFTVMWFFFWILWIFLVVRIILDIFASHDLGGWGKAGWTILVVLLPFLGVFCYLIARGHKMQDRQRREAQAHFEASRSYVRDAAGTGNGSADELAKLADLRDRGVITESEFEQGKAKILA
jgi:hypothetical protein